MKTRKPIRKAADPISRSISPGAEKPLWRGPQIDGITYSLLCKFLCCRDRFWLRVVKGVKEVEEFKYQMHYGSMWHECEEAHAGGKDWHKPLGKYCEKLKDEYPTHIETIDKWKAICALQFPLYVNYWRSKAQASIIPIIEEKKFRVPYVLPSGRTVVLRGKFDSVFGINKTIKLKENKTKGEIDEEGIQSTVDQNLQTMIYHIALRELQRGILQENDPGAFGLPVAIKQHDDNIAVIKALWDYADWKIGGTVYNVVRRPLSDRYAIKQKKSENLKQFLKRLGGVITKDAARYFIRWNITLSHKDVETFKTQCFNAILEQLCDWWESIKDFPFEPWTTMTPKEHPTPYEVIPNPHHFRFPYGVYNSLTGGFRGDYFNLLAKRSESSLVRIESLFPELDNE